VEPRRPNRSPGLRTPTGRGYRVPCPYLVLRARKLKVSFSSRPVPGSPTSSSSRPPPTGSTRDGPEPIADGYGDGSLVGIETTR